MASFRRLASGNWQAMVSATIRTQSGVERKRQYKTFPKLSDARRWADQQEPILRRWATER